MQRMRTEKVYQDTLALLCHSDLMGLCPEYMAAQLKVASAHGMAFTSGEPNSACTRKCHVPCPDF